LRTGTLYQRRASGTREAEASPYQSRGPADLFHARRPKISSLAATRLALDLVPYAGPTQSVGAEVTLALGHGMSRTEGDIEE
jgi:hypothetical protein